jgi:RNA polymerase sigma factor (sigma-70 family)
VPEAKLTSVLRQLRHVVARRCDGGLSDTELLERFAAVRDPAAFEVLVWRHGPMVFGLCRRVLGNHHDAEDALQATFLALARQAGSISKRGSLTSWLCKVAYRVALRARNQSAKHAADALPVEEVPAHARPEPALAAELRLAVDEELQRLPEKYGSALVLCYWSGFTNREIASLLGCPLGTVSTRLARGRALLRSRLARRGVTLTAAGLASWFGEPAAAALPPASVQATVGRRPCSLPQARTRRQVLSRKVSWHWAQGVLQMTTFTKLTAVAVVLLVLAGIGAGAAWLAPTSSAEAQGKAPPAAPSGNAQAAEPPAQPKKEALRYGGKTFDDWHTVLTTDLKPEVRAEAVKALSAFGTSGYAKPAATAIVGLMREYHVKAGDTDDQRVVQAALLGISKIGAEALPVLVEELHKGNANGRRFALQTLPTLEPTSKAIVLAVADRLKDNDQDIRHSALDCLRQIDSHGFSVAALAEILVNDAGLREPVVKLLGEFGDQAKPAVAQLVKSVKDDPEIRGPALEALRKIDPDVPTVMPALVAALADKDRNVRIEAINYLGNLGPAAKDAVQPLITAWKTADDSERFSIADVFGNMGPAAKDALPLLLEAMSAVPREPGLWRRRGPRPGVPQPVMQSLKDAIREAVHRINP